MNPHQVLISTQSKILLWKSCQSWRSTQTSRTPLGELLKPKRAHLENQHWVLDAFRKIPREWDVPSPQVSGHTMHVCRKHWSIQFSTMVDMSLSETSRNNNSWAKKLPQRFRILFRLIHEMRQGHLAEFALPCPNTEQSERVAGTWSLPSTCAMDTMITTIAKTFSVNSEELHDKPFIRVGTV